MNKNKNQRGIGLLNVVFTLMILGVLVVFGLQIGLGYMDRNVIYKSVNNVLIEAKNNDYSPKTIKDNISNRLSINNIQINNNDIDITDTGRGYVVKIDYVKSIRVNDDISIVMNFLIEGSTP